MDVRIIVATNENLEQAVRVGDFREDLFHRLNEFQIDVPALRERTEDIPLFARYFLEQANGELNRSIDGFEPEVLNKLRTYHCRATSGSSKTWSDARRFYPPAS